MKNLGLKLVSLAVAILIWAQITLTATHQTSVMLDLKITSPLPGESIPQGTYKLPLTVSGRGIDIMKLRHSKALIQMNEESIRAGKHDNYELVNSPENLGLRILGIDPFALPELQKKMLSRTDPSDANNQAALSKESGVFVVNVPLPSVSDIAYFPSTITFKVKAGKAMAASLRNEISIKVEETPSANGFYSITPKAPAGVKILDFNPKQVRHIN